MARAENVVLIHADCALGSVAAGAAQSACNDHQAQTRIRSLAAYCEWLSRQVGSVYLLVPDAVRARLEAAGDRFGGAELLGYGHDRRVRCPSVSTHATVWLINGERMPLVDWTSAAASARRGHGQVVLFGTATVPASEHYSESVVVGAEDEVLGFTRNYDDSAYFADLSSGEPSFAVTTGAWAPGVVTHLLSRGWGLDSVGAMTRRFSVSWAKRPCQLDDTDGASSPWLPSAPAAGYEAVSNGALPEPVGFEWRSLCAGSGSPTLQTTDGMGTPAASTPYGGSAAPSFGPTRWLRLPREAAGTQRRRESHRVSHAAVAGGPIYLFAKRALDFSASLVGLAVLSPLLLTIALLIKLTSRGPVFFAHRRQGLNGREFNCLKFRSMRDGADALQAKLRAQNEVDGPQFKMASDPRLTPLGHFLRESNLDELPQLINVLLGDMSLVGPRPSPDNENQLCPAWRRTRLSVKPGITGLWQVLRCRKYPESDFQQWIAYDVAYARHRSFWLDLQIILYTPLSMRSPRHVTGFAARLERNGVCSPVSKLQAGDTFRE